MRFLVRLKAPGVPQQNLLRMVRTVAKALGASLRNPKWTSYGALELDVFCPSEPDFDLFLSAIGPMTEIEFARDLNSAPPYKEEGELLSEAKALFNAERYWECHEVLEGLWKTKQGEEKHTLQGFILVSAAFVHHQKGEDDVALGILRRASKLLESKGPSYHEVDLPLLRARVQQCLRLARLSEFSL